MGNEGKREGDELRIVTDAGYQMIWAHNIGDVWVIDECRVVLADATLSPRSVADALWREFCAPLAY